MQPHREEMTKIPCNLTRCLRLRSSGDCECLNYQCKVNHIVPALQFQLRQRKSNLTMVLEYLKELGYSCCARKLKSSDYGLPQRRSRYYIFGFRSSVDFAQSASALAELIPSRLQTMASSECSPVAEVPDFFYQVHLIPSTNWFRLQCLQRASAGKLLLLCSFSFHVKLHS